ncbi:MAG TPA: tannase/feruloyl esterase family alpha/beta hydrolase [Trebonia sp.]
MARLRFGAPLRRRAPHAPRGPRPAVLGIAFLAVAGLVLLGFQLAAPAGASAAAAATQQAATATKPAAAVTPVVSCAELAKESFGKAVPGAPTTITSAKLITSTGSSYCDVQGSQPPQLQFDLRLPVSTWTGRYVQEGCGGYCGAVTPGAPAAATDCPAVTGNELALATDNEGHNGAIFSATFGSDPAERISYAYTSEHNLDLAAKAIISAYYGHAPSDSYFDGCSDGGREALVEAERYPHDFNGILAGSPEIYATELNGEVQAWNILANMDSSGHEILTADKLPALHAAVDAKCANGQGYIADPRTCDFNPASIECPSGANASDCLTPAQVAVVVKLYQGPRDPQGQNLYPGGEPYGSELAWSQWFIDPASDTAWPKDTVDYGAATGMLDDLAFATNPPASFSLTDWKFTLRNYEKLTALNGLNDATDPDLNAFARAGGKIIIYHGWADPAINPFGTVNYYKSVVNDAGGYAASQQFSRLYMVPGGYHCLGGGAPSVSVDLLDPLFNWVERGAAPGAEVASLTQPTATLKAITVTPFNPHAPVAGNGLNSSYHWVGRLLRPGSELWCDANAANTAMACSTEPDKRSIS